MANRDYAQDRFGVYSGLAVIAMGIVLSIGELKHYFDNPPQPVQELKIDHRNLKSTPIEKHPAITEVSGEPILKFLGKH